jgi:SAM-dependent methyltransferase
MGQFAMHHALTRRTQSLAGLAARGSARTEEAQSADEAVPDDGRYVRRGFVALPGAEVYIALQRTSYQHPINLPFRIALPLGPHVIGVGRWYDKWILPLVESRRTNLIFQKYFDEMRKEYEIIKQHLPPRAKRILDLGCGIAGIDVLLWDHYGGGTAFYLLDASELSAVRYGFGESVAYYNSLRLTRQFLLRNRVPSDQIVTIDIQRDSFPSNTSFDAIFSLISWGYHYPVTTYLDPAYDALKPGGSLILDVRRRTPGKQQVAGKFGVEPEVIYETKKFERLVVRKQQRLRLIARGTQNRDRRGGSSASGRVYPFPRPAG